MSHAVILKTGKHEARYEFAKLGRPGQWSALKDGAAAPYLINLVAKTCTCGAGRNSRQCKHRSAALKLEVEMSGKKPEAVAAEPTTTAVAKAEDRSVALARILTKGDLGELTEEGRASYYLAVCNACDLNPASRPFEYTVVRGKHGNKTILYATKSCGEQLRKKDRLSLTIVNQREENGLYIVTVEAATPDGRKDTDIGATPVGTGNMALQGEDRANAVMKAITKAKRRVTLSICGLGMLDESEVESVGVVQAAPAPVFTPAAAQPVIAQPVAVPPVVTQPVTTAPPAEAPKPALDRMATLRAIDEMAKRLNLDDAKLTAGLQRAYGKPTLQACLDDELADLHKRLAAKVPAANAA